MESSISDENDNDVKIEISSMSSGVFRGTPRQQRNSVRSDSEKSNNSDEEDKKDGPSYISAKTKTNFSTVSKSKIGTIETQNASSINKNKPISNARRASTIRRDSVKQSNIDLFNSQ